MRIRLLSEVTLFKYNVSTILSLIVDRIYCINFIIGLAILDTSYLNMHFFGTHTCLCRLQNSPSADFGVFNIQVRVSSNTKGLKRG